MNTRHGNKLNYWVRVGTRQQRNLPGKFKAIEDDSEDRFGELTRFHWFINIILAEF